MLLKDNVVYVYNDMILHHDTYNIGKRYFAITEDRPQYEYGVVIEAETQIALLHQLSNLGL